MEQTIGKRISENRKRLGLTQDALAEKLGVTAQAVSKWENDQSCPDITMLPKLAEIFDISTDVLLGVETHQKVHEAEIIEEKTADKDSRGPKGSWEFEWSSGKRGALSFALFVLLVGFLALISPFLCPYASFWDILWPSAFLVFGLARLFRKFSVFSMGCVLLGGYFLLYHLLLWRLEIREESIIPVILILFGFGLLIDALRKPNKSKLRVFKDGVKLFDKNGSEKTESTFAEDDESFNCNLSFGEKAHTVALSRLCCGNANCAFGELTVDLSGCDSVSEDCQIDANASFGELVILIPGKYRAQIDSHTFFAAVSVKGQPDPEPQGKIEINANATFGAILIKYL